MGINLENLELVTVDNLNISKLHRLNTMLFPVRYNIKFYKNILGAPEIISKLGKTIIIFICMYVYVYIYCLCIYMYIVMFQNKAIGSFSCRIQSFGTCEMPMGSKESNIFYKEDETDNSINNNDNSRGNSSNINDINQGIYLYITIK
jgi:hypothetical protein